MTKLQQELCRIFDFDEDHWEIAYNEAQSKQKLIGTWCVINGKLGYVSGLDPLENKIKVEFPLIDDKSWVNCESFDVFLPESGLYVLDGACASLEKVPLKQWKKSFSLDVFKYSFIKHHNIYKEVYFLFKAKQVPFYFGNGKVYVSRESIGQINADGLISLTNSNFYQDLLDWITKENLAWSIQ